MDAQLYDDLLRFLGSKGEETRVWPTTLRPEMKSKRNNFRRLATGFAVGTGGELLKVVGVGKNPLHVVCGDAEKERVLNAHHGHEAGGGHFGVCKTYLKIAERYWWRSVHTDVREHVATCVKCQKHNAIRKTHGELHPVAFSDRPFALWGVDLVGPLPETPRGKKYIMTVTNYLTRWASAFAIADKSALTVCDSLGELICQFGAPERIISDQGREFINQVNDALFSGLQIKHSICTAYHPQSNGLTERFNQTLERVLAKMVNEEQVDWDSKLKWAVFSYNTSCQSSMKESPFFMMFGVRARLPLELDHLSGTTDAITWEDTGSDTFQGSIERRMKVLQDLPVIQRMGKANIEAAQSKQKGIYDAKHKGVTFQVGEKVLYYNARNSKRQGGKLDVKYLGPKVIAEVFSNGTVRLQGMKSLHSTKFLKHFKDVSAPEDDDVQELPGPTRRTATLVNIRYVFRPPTKDWMKKACNRLGLTFVGRTQPHGRASGTVFNYSSRPARLLNSIVGDGNCLFRALCWWISGSQDGHEVLRRAVCAKMRAKKMDDYLGKTKMEQINTWGGIDEVMIVSELLDDIPIITFLQTGGLTGVQAVPSDVKSRAVLDYRGIYLDWRNHHYEVVLSVKV